MSRINSKKHISYMNLRDIDLRKVVNESVNMFLLHEAKMSKEDALRFEEWKGVFDGYLSDMIDELQSEYLNRLGLSISINQNYNFGRRRWFACYEASLQQITNGVISIAINYPLLYSEMRKRGIDDDDYNIEAQARITVGHEIGHGLVDYIKHLDLDASVLKDLPNLRIIKRCGSSKEETLVEEFGNYQFSDATYVYDSVLADAFEELISML